MGRAAVLAGVVMCAAVLSTTALPRQKRQISEELREMLAAPYSGRLPSSLEPLMRGNKRSQRNPGTFLGVNPAPEDVLRGPQRQRVPPPAPNAFQTQQQQTFQPQRQQEQFQPRPQQPRPQQRPQQPQQQQGFQQRQPQPQQSFQQRQPQQQQQQQFFQQPQQQQNSQQRQQGFEPRRPQPQQSFPQFQQQRRRPVRQPQDSFSQVVPHDADAYRPGRPNFGEGPRFRREAVSAADLQAELASQLTPGRS